VEFERQRARNIARNERVLDNLGVNRLPELIESVPRTSTAGTRRVTRSATKPARAAAAEVEAAAAMPSPDELELRRKYREAMSLLERATAAKKPEVDEQSRLARRRERKRAWRAKMTDSEKKDQRARRRERLRAAVAKMTNPEKKDQRARDTERKRAWRAKMTDSEKKDQRARRRERYAKMTNPEKEKI